MDVYGEMEMIKWAIFLKDEKPKDNPIFQGFRTYATNAISEENQ